MLQKGLKFYYTTNKTPLRNLIIIFKILHCLSYKK